MIRMPSSIFFRKNASAILSAFGGGLRPVTIVGIALLLVSLNCFSSALNEVISDRLIGQSNPLNVWIWNCSQLVFFPVFLVFCYCIVRKHSQCIKTDVKVFKNPRRGRALVLFLSPASAVDKSLVEQLTKAGGRIADKKVRESFKGAWRMPLEAIAYHLYGLDQVVVIATEGDKDTDGTQIRKGSLDDYPKFKSLVNALTSTEGAGDSPRLDIRLPADIGIQHKALKSGSFKEINRVVNEVSVRLNTVDHIKDLDIVVDITGGTKICSVAGAVVSLGRGKRFQYVNTETYEIVEYDVTVEGTPE
jgi:hypothetical protein